MKAVFRTPLTPEDVRAILATAPPERIDCALLRYSAPATPASRDAASAASRRREEIEAGFVDRPTTPVAHAVAS
jgi:hypothetical protein